MKLIVDEFEHKVKFLLFGLTLFRVNHRTSQKPLKVSKVIANKTFLTPKLKPHRNRSRSSRTQNV